MIKNYYFILILLLLTSQLFAQSVEVIGRDIITDKDQGEFYYPRFSNSGRSIVFSGDAYEGLWIYESNSGSIRKLNSYKGAGNGALFTEDDQNIVFRAYKFENMKRVSNLYIQNIFNGETKELVSENKALYPPLKGTSKSINVVENGKVKNLTSLLKKSVSQENNIAVFIENSKIVIAARDEKTILEPLAEGNYIWPSLSPDGTKLMFTKAGSGTYISDLQGNILQELGKANYPVWAKDGEWVVYMNDKDDGYVFTGSEIEMINIESKQRFNLTSTENIIEMYPDYSLSTDEVVYHTLSGQIIKLKLKFN